MSLQLFEHNQTAYEDALAMLEATGKAAVVHPTGTGKSYIGFKLCEKFPECTICWLSPSEYIYKTQLENLKDDSDGWQPENVKFFTYAKLMLMSDVELDEIKPDYIILDEFHRCGAEMWGEGVNRLLDMYPDIPLLGLTATSIRYLDNQRNMKIPKHNSSGYKGVGYRQDRGKYRAYISLQNRTKHLGYFQYAEEAARAYDQAARYYFGNFACLNFPSENEQGCRRNANC